MTRPGRKPTPPETINARLEDYLWLVETGEHPERIAARLGMTPKTLEKFLWRARKAGLLNDKEAA